MKYLPASHHLSFLRDLVSQIPTAFVTCNFHCISLALWYCQKSQWFPLSFLPPSAWLLSCCRTSPHAQSMQRCREKESIMCKLDSHDELFCLEPWLLHSCCLGNALTSSSRFFLLGYFIQSFLGNFICYKLIKGTICWLYFKTNPLKCIDIGPKPGHPVPCTKVLAQSSILKMQSVGYTQGRNTRCAREESRMTPKFLSLATSKSVLYLLKRERLQTLLGRKLCMWIYKSKVQMTT